MSSKMDEMHPESNSLSKNLKRVILFRAQTKYVF